MTEFYNPNTKISKTIEQIKSDNTEVSFPSQINNDVMKSLNYFPVLPSAIPIPSSTTKVVSRNGVTLKNGKYYEVWLEQDRFSGSDKKAKDEKYQATLDASEKNNVRSKREPLLLEADHKINTLEDAGADASAWKAYRQKLRDVTKNSDMSFPEKP